MPRDLGADSGWSDPKRLRKESELTVTHLARFVTSSEWADFAGSIETGTLIEPHLECPVRVLQDVLESKSPGPIARQLGWPVVLPHPGMLPDGLGIASSECSRRGVTLSIGDPFGIRVLRPEGSVTWGHLTIIHRGEP